jgi:hypothetical protein
MTVNVIMRAIRSRTVEVMREAGNKVFAGRNLTRPEEISEPKRKAMNSKDEGLGVNLVGS